MNMNIQDFINKDRTQTFTTDILGVYVTMQSQLFALWQ